MRQISAGELTRMRDLQEDAMPDTAQIRSRTLAADGMGGYTETWADGDLIACRVAAYEDRTGMERLLADRIGSRVAWEVTVPAATEVDVDDRVVVGSRVFEVVGVRAAWSYETARRLVCVELL